MLKLHLLCAKYINKKCGLAVHNVLRLFGCNNPLEMVVVSWEVDGLAGGEIEIKT